MSTLKKLSLLLLMAGLGQHASGLDTERALRIDRTTHIFSSVAGSDQVTTEDYCYRSGQFAVLDSLLCSFYLIPSGGGADYYTMYCQTQITQTDSLTTIYDYTVRNSQAQLIRRTVLETDLWGRKVKQQEYSNINSLMNQISWFFAPGGSTQVDSVVTYAPAGPSPYPSSHNKYVYSYDQFGRKSTVGLWIFAGGEWIYQGYYENQFSGALPFSIDTQQPPLSFYPNLFTMFPLLLDETACISSYTFNPVSGAPTTFYVQNETYGQYRYSSQWSDGGTEWGWELWFESNGKIVRRSVGDWEGGGTPGWGSQHAYLYFWEDAPVANSDEYQTPGFSDCRVYPNPFTETLTIAADGKGASEVYVYNLRGQLVRVIQGHAGTAVVWDGADSRNEPAASGVYLIRIDQNGHSDWIKALKIK